MRRSSSLLAAATVAAASLTALGTGTRPAAAADACASTPPLQVLQTAIGHLSYTVHTEVKMPAGNTLVKDTPAVVGIPTLVSPRGGVPDLLVSVLPNLGKTLTLRVNRLSSASLSMRVEAVVPVTADLTARVGYDALDVADPTAAEPFHTVATTAPANWSLDAAIQRCTAGTLVALTQSTAARTAPLALVGGVSTDPTTTAAELALQPVPATTELTAAITGDDTAPTRTATFGIAPSEPTSATVDARLVNGRQTDVHAELPGLSAAATDHLPVAQLASVDESTEDRQRHGLTFSSTTRLDSARVVYRQTAEGRRLVDVTATARNLPHELSLDIVERSQGGVTTHEVDYSSPLVRGRPERLGQLTVNGSLAEPQESVGAVPDTTSVAANAVGVPQHLRISLTPPDENAPEHLAAALTAGSDGLVIGQALGSLDVQLARDDQPTILNADEQLPTDQDGALVRATKGIRQQRQTVDLQVTGLRELTFSKSAAPAAGDVGVTQRVVNTHLVTDPTDDDRSFRVRLEQVTGSLPVTFNQATVDPLPADVTVGSVSKERGDGSQVLQQVDYDAQGEHTDSIQFATNAGSRKILRAELHSPDGAAEPQRVPADLHFCISPLTGRCSGAVLTSAQRDKDGISFQVSVPDQDGELHGSFFECVDGPSADTCSPENSSDFKVARFNVTPVGFIALDIDAPPVKNGEHGHVFFDTDDNALNGDLEILAGATDPCEEDDTHIVGKLENVRAQDRFAAVEVENAGCVQHGLALTQESGTMSCGDDTVIDLNAGKFAGGVANDFCRNP